MGSGKYYYGFIPGNPEELKTHLERFQTYFLVAEFDGWIVGYINGSIHVSNRLAVIPQGEQYLEIDNLYVKQGFRNELIGGKLIERLLQIAEQNGIRRFLVHSATKDMDKILNFYRRHGFKTWNVEMFK